MALSVNRTNRGLRSLRDFRGEVLSLAMQVAPLQGRGTLTLVAPVVSEATLRSEWGRLQRALAEDLRGRLDLVVEHAPASVSHRAVDGVEHVSLGQPTYRCDVLRLLLQASLRREPPPTIPEIVKRLGVSQTPVRRALRELGTAGLVRRTPRGIEAVLASISQDSLARIRALPRQLKFRFELGAHVSSPSQLLQRALQLLQPHAGQDWGGMMALSGVPAAQHEAPAIDIVGVPRLDLVATLPSTVTQFDARLLRRLDDGLEYEPNVLAPAPVVVTIVRTAAPDAPARWIDGVRLASESEVWLALLDQGLRQQAIEYAAEVHR